MSEEHVDEERQDEEREEKQEERKPLTAQDVALRLQAMRGVVDPHREVRRKHPEIDETVSALWPDRD
jgi:hypothetical protein